MEGLQLFLMLFLVVGFAAGAGAVWLVLQGRTNSAYARARAELQAAMDELNERLRLKQEQIQALQSRLDQNLTALEAVKVEAAGISAEHSATLREKAELAAKLEQREQTLAALASELDSARALRDAPPPPPPPTAAPTLEILARPIEEHLADLRVRLEQLSAAPRPEPELSEEVLQRLARPFQEQLAELRRVVEGLLPPPPPAPAVDAGALQDLARPIEEQLRAMQQRLDQMHSSQSLEAARAAELSAHNAELAGRLAGVNRELGQLRAALARSLDLCSLAVAAAASPAAETGLGAEPQSETVSIETVPLI